MVIPADGLTPINQLVYRGTHNSYDQRRKVTVEAQVDDFGVWAVELDYAIPAASQRELITSHFGRHDAWFRVPPPCVIGHDGPGECADDAGPVFGGAPDYLLTDQLTRLAATQASAYRPLIIYLDKKPWLLFPNRIDDPAYDNEQQLYARVGAELRAAFGGRLFTPPELQAFTAEHHRHPTVPELANRVIAIATGGGGSEAIFPEGFLFQDYANEQGCARPEAMAPIPVPPPHVWRNDNFSSPWTWDYAAPPNPLVVAATAPPTTTILGCSEDADEVVNTQASPQGTRLVPFRRVSDALERARGRLSSGTYGGTAQRGMGFTALITPGHYPEALHIDFPFRLANREPSAGTARIGG